MKLARFVLEETCYRWHKTLLRMLHVAIALVKAVPVVLGSAVELSVVFVACLRTLLAVPGRSTSSLYAILGRVETGQSPGVALVLAAAAAAELPGAEPNIAGPILK